MRQFEFAAGVLLLSFLATGCATVATTPPLMAQMEGLEVTPKELRVRSLDYAEYFAVTVEDAATEIIWATPDPEIRRRAVVWKVSAVSSLIGAMSQTDPLAAIIETATFTFQMADYFETGAGSDRFGPAQQIAIDACSRLEARTVEFVESFTHGEYPRVREAMRRWVDEHPIQSPLFARDSIIVLVADMMQNPDTRAFASLGRLELTVNDLMARLTMYSAALPRLARWQAELLIYDTLHSEQPLGQLLADTRELLAGIDRIALLSEGMPGLIQGEREAILLAVQTLVDKQMGDLDLLVDEHRQALIQDIETERVAIFDSIDAQRLDTIAAFDDRSEEILGFVQAMGIGAVSQTSIEVERLMSRAFWGALELVMIFLVGLLIVLVVARRIPQRVQRAHVTGGSD
jgi:hypothetical protein